MKIKTNSLLLALAVMAFGVMSFNITNNGDPTAKEIVKKADEKFKGNSSKATLTMKIVRPKYTRTMTMKSWSMGDEYSLMKVMAPARDKGIGYLKRGNEIWNYQPNIDRSIKLPPSMMSQSWMGSDMTNDDLVRQSSIVDDYEHTLLKKETIDGRLCYVIELVPNDDAAVVWGMVKMWIDTKDYLQLKVEFYDEDEYLVNTTYGKNIKKMDDRVIPTTMEIVPEDKPGHKTILTYDDIDFNVSLKSSFFSISNMKRIR